MVTFSPSSSHPEAKKKVMVLTAVTDQTIKGNWITKFTIDVRKSIFTT